MSKFDVADRLGITTQFSKGEILLGIDTLIKFYHMNEMTALRNIEGLIDIAIAHKKSIAQTIILMLGEKDSGNCLGYTGEECTQCGRVRVEAYENGDKICEKCFWNETTKKYENRCY